MAKRRAGLLALYVGAPRPYYSLMTQDNAYAFSTFAAIGGTDYEGETFSSMRIFASYEAALDYAWELIDDGLGYDYAYVAGVRADGSLEQNDMTRVDNDGLSGGR